jgi:hypothetical protein
MRAVLEVIAPQAHAGDHEATATILHTGSHESLAVELVRLFIYLETNNMVDQFETITGCRVDLSAFEDAMDFLRRMGFLTKANINCLGRSTDPTSRVFLSRLLRYSIVDANSFDVLGWLIPSHFDVNHSVPMLEYHAFPEGPIRESVKRQEHTSDANLLQACSLVGNINAVGHLLNLGADPYDASGPQDYSPLECVASLTDHARANIIADLLLSKPTRSSSEYQKEALEVAFQLAIENSNTRLIVRLLSECQRLGDATISSQHLTLAVSHADCDTVRLLIDTSSHSSNRSIALPNDILFAAVSPSNKDPEVAFDKFKYLLDLGADPAVSRCRRGCFMGSLLNRAIAFRPSNPSHRPEDEENRVLKMVKSLREHGCTPERPKTITTGIPQPSALQLAISRNFPRLVEYLLDWGVDIDFCGDEYEPVSSCENCYAADEVPFYPVGPVEGRSPLLTALKTTYGGTEIAKILLRRKPNLKLYGGEQKFAMERGDDTELVTMLLQADSANKDGWKDFLRQAILQQRPESVKLLLSMDTDGHATIDSVTILRAALLTGDYDKACQQVSVCCYDSWSLLEALKQSQRSKDYLEIVDRLLEARQPTSNDDFEIVAVACAAVNHDMHLLSALVKTLEQGPWIAHFPDHNSFQYDPSRWVLDDAEPAEHIIDFLSVYRNDKVIKTLLELNVPVKGMRFDTGDRLTAETWKQLFAAGLEPKPLHLIDAVFLNMLTHVKVLHEAKVSWNTMHISKIVEVSRTAIQVAVQYGGPEMLPLLLEYGADMDYPAGYYCGATCLQLAAGAGNIGLVHFLLGKGAKVNAKRSLYDGRTAIEIAAENGRLDVLKLLLLQEEHLFRTAAERYQFIRAAKLAEQEGHATIVKMLREHINWNNCDQLLFDEIQSDDSLQFQFDDMTQEALECERREPDFWSTLDEAICEAERADIYDIVGIEQWIGERPDQQSDHWTTSETDFSTGKVRMHLNGSLAAGQHRNANHEELPSNLDGPVELMPTYDDTDDEMLDSEDLHDYRMAGWPATQSRPLSPHPRYGETATAVAPQAMRYEGKVPTWLNMQDNGIDDMMQGVTHDLAGHVGKWEALVHRPLTENVGQTPGMVLGEVLGGELYVNGIGDDAVNRNSGEGVGEGEHAQHFDWGFWDGEGIGRDLGNLLVQSSAMEA